MREIQVNGRVIEISHKDKVLFPGSGITKGDLVGYYRGVSRYILAHTEDRPITMQRFPGGTAGSGFYQKSVPGHFPQWMDRVRVEKKEGGSMEYVLCNSPAALAFLANQDCVTLHTWLSRADRIDCPDRLVLDLDPPGADFEPVRRAALALRELLQGWGLSPMMMTTGSRGGHVRTALRPEAHFEDVRSFARGLAQDLVERDPGAFTTAQRKAERGDRVFIDVLRNSYGQTCVAPYSVRPLEGAPVATPLHWSELERTDLHSQYYRLENIVPRLERKGDPWQGMAESAVPLPG